MNLSRLLHSEAEKTQGKVTHLGHLGWNFFESWIFSHSLSFQHKCGFDWQIRVLL